MSVAGRAYLVYRERITGATLSRDRDPIGYIWLTYGDIRTGSTWLDTARAKARELYHLPANERAHCLVDTTTCERIRKRRDKLEQAAGPYPEGACPETFAESYRAIETAARRRRMLARGQGHPQTSPGGNGLL